MDWVCDMLNYLMSVHDVEGFIWKWQRVDIAFLEGDVGDTLGRGEGTSSFEGRGSGFDTGDVAGWYEGRKTGGDATGATANIEDFGGGLEVWKEVGRAVLGGAPRVGAQDGSAVVGAVDLGCHRECWVFGRLIVADWKY
jgi:hypothetical protein